MRLEYLQVRNFKALEDVSFSLEPATVLIGPNDAGKSTILDALRFLFRQSDRFGRAFNSSEVGNAVVIGTFSDLSTTETQDYARWIEDGKVRLGARFVGERDQVTHKGLAPVARASNVAALGHNFEPWLVEDGDGWYEPRVLASGALQKLAWMNFEEPVLVMLPGPEVGPPDVESLIRPLLDEAWYEHDLGEAAGRALVELIANGLEPIRRALSAAAPAYLQGIQGVHIADRCGDDEQEALAVAQKELLRELRLSLIPRGIGDFDPGDPDAPAGAEPIGRAGAGAQRALALAALELYLDKELIGDRSVILAVEEPEVGLHPGAQRRIAQRLATVPTFGVQTIVVTHSPTILDATPLNGIRVVRSTPLEVDGKLVHRRDVLIPEGLDEVVRSVGSSPSDVLLSDRFVIVEGETDVMVFRKWAQLRGFDLPAAKVQVFPVRGHMKAENITAFVKLAYPGARFWVVLDSGPESERSAQGIRERISKPVSVRVLSKPAIEGFYPNRAVFEWLSSQGTVVDENLALDIEALISERPSGKDALQYISNKYLRRDYDPVHDGLAIASLMREGEVPPEFVDLLMDVTSR